MKPGVLGVTGPRHEELARHDKEVTRYLADSDAPPEITKDGIYILHV